MQLLLELKGFERCEFDGFSVEISTKSGSLATALSSRKWAR